MTADFFTDPVMAEVERLREQVLSLGDEVTALGRENVRLAGELRAELKTVQDALCLAGHVVDMRRRDQQPQGSLPPRIRHGLYALPGGAS